MSYLKFPKKINSGLSELIGIYLGDGHLYKNGLIISCGTIDSDYITKYIPNLVKRVFNKESNLYFSKTSKLVQYKVYSREIVRYLNLKFNFKLGKKKDIVIPKELFNNKENLKECIKGLVDTDGGIYRHHKNNLQLIFFNSQITLIKSLKYALESLNFNPRIGKNNNNYCLYLFGKEVIRYHSEIGFSNSKNIAKYNHWLKYGKIPLNRELKCTSRDSNPGYNVFANNGNVGS